MRAGITVPVFRLHLIQEVASNQVDGDRLKFERAMALHHKLKGGSNCEAMKFWMESVEILDL